MAKSTISMAIFQFAIWHNQRVNPQRNHSHGDPGPMDSHGDPSPLPAPRHHPRCCCLYPHGPGDPWAGAGDHRPTALGCLQSSGFWWWRSIPKCQWLTLLNGFKSNSCIMILWSHHISSVSRLDLRKLELIGVTWLPIMFDNLFCTVVWQHMFHVTQPNPSPRSEQCIWQQGGDIIIITMIINKNITMTITNIHIDSLLLSPILEFWGSNFISLCKVMQVYCE